MIFLPSHIEREREKDQSETKYEEIYYRHAQIPDISFKERERECV